MYTCAFPDSLLFSNSAAALLSSSGCATADL